jgi:hypothetical protein
LEAPWSFCFSFPLWDSSFLPDFLQEAQFGGHWSFGFGCSLVCADLSSDKWGIWAGLKSQVQGPKTAQELTCTEKFQPAESTLQFSPGGGSFQGYTQQIRIDSNFIVKFTQQSLDFCAVPGILQEMRRFGGRTQFQSSRTTSWMWQGNTVTSILSFKCCTKGVYIGHGWGPKEDGHKVW